MEASTYVQRIAQNYDRGLAPFPEPLEIAEEYLAGCPAERLRVGLSGLYQWMARVYRGAADSPADFGLPCYPDLLPRSGSKYTASVRAVEAIPIWIFALGLSGAPLERGDQVWLQVDRQSLDTCCQEAGIKKGSAILDALGKHGLEIAPDMGTADSLVVRFTAAPDAALALPAFVKACCALTRKGTRPPLEFYRADLRVMQPVRGRRRPPPVTVADALRPLDDERAAILAGLDRLVESLGFRAQFKCSSLNRGEWRGSYKSSKLGKTLFGSVVEEGQLAVRIMIGETSRIVPVLEQCPPSLRAAFCAAHACQRCGKCKVGPVRTSLDGTSCRLCNYALFVVPNVRSEQAAGVRMLLEAQASILQTDGGH
jgi:hypothetical protein